MRVNSTLIASLQGSVTGGQELEVPEALLPVIALPLPLQGMQNVLPVGGVELRNVPGSTHVYTILNQGINQATSFTQVLATLDRGVYQIKGNMLSVFLGFTPSSADPFGCILQLIPPGGAGGVVMGITPMHNPAASASSAIPVPFDFLYQITQPGWQLKFDTFHATGAAQSIGAFITAQINRML